MKGSWWFQAQFLKMCVLYKGKMPALLNRLTWVQTFFLLFSWVYGICVFVLVPRRYVHAGVLEEGKQGLKMSLNSTWESYQAITEYLCGTTDVCFYNSLLFCCFTTLFFLAFFFVNFIIHLYFFPRVLKANNVRADAYIVTSWFSKYLFTMCYVLHTGETKVSQAEFLL